MRPFRTNTQKRCPFHYRRLECKSRKSRNTWGNRQIGPWNTEWSRAKVNRVLPREHTGHSKHRLPTTQEKTLHMCCKKMDPFQGLKLGSCLTRKEMNCPRRHMCWQSKRFYWERAPGWGAVGQGNPGELLCRVARSLRFYGDGLSFQVVFGQSF